MKAVSPLLGKAKAALAKIQPKYGERITIAGEPVYLDTPTDPLKFVKTRIYLKKHYLPGDAFVVDDSVKDLFKTFIERKELPTCTKDLSDILRSGLNHRLQTIEDEIVVLRKERGNSISLRQRVAHAQELKDLLEILAKEVRRCIDDDAAIKRASEIIATKQVQPLTEDQIRTLVKKFAVLILHAKEPVDADRPKYNAPAVSIIEKLGEVSELTNPEIEAFLQAHSSSPLLLHIFQLGQLGAEEYDNVFIKRIYSDLLDEIKNSLKGKDNDLDIFMETLSKENPLKDSHEQIAAILTRVGTIMQNCEQMVQKLSNEAAELQKKIEELDGKVKSASDDTASATASATESATEAKAELEKLKGELAAAKKALEDKTNELKIKTTQLRDFKLSTEAIKSQARNKERELIAKIASIDAELAASNTALKGLEEKSAATETELAKLRDTLAEKDGEIAAARAAAEASESGSKGAAAAAAVAATAAAAATAAEIEDLRNKLKAAEDAAAEAATATAAEQAKVSAAEKAKVELEALLSTEKSDHANDTAALQKQIEDAKGASETAATTLATAQADLAAIRAEKEECKKQLEAAGGKHAELEARITELDTQDKDQKAKIKQLGEGAAVAAAALAAKEKEALESKAAVDRLSKEMALFKQEVEAGKAALDAQINKLTADLKTSRGETAIAAAKLASEMERLQEEAKAKLEAELAAQKRESDTKLQQAAAKVAAAETALQSVQKQIEKYEEEKRSLVGQLAAQKNKNATHAAELKAKEAACLVATAAATQEAAAAKKAADEASSKTIQAAAESHKAEVAALTQRLGALQKEVEKVKSDEAAKVVAAEKARDEAIQKIKDGAAGETARLQAAIAAAGAALSKAEGTAAAVAAKAKTDAENEAAAHATALKAASLAAETECTKKTDEAAARAQVIVNRVADDFAKLTDELKKEKASHTDDVEKLKAQYKADLTKALADAKAATEAEFAERVKALDGDKSKAVTAAVEGARAAAAADLQAKLAEAAKKAEATTSATRASVIAEKDAELAKIRQEGAVAADAAAKRAKEAAETDFKAREVKLQGEKDSAVAAAIAKVRGEKDAEFKTKEATLAAAGLAATAAAVAAADKVSREKRDAAVVTAKQEQKGEDLATLKTFATQVLAGQAKWSGYPGAGSNAALAGLLGKLDSRMNDICALVYFVSYFLNTMVKRAVDEGSGTTPAQLINNIENLIPKNSEEELFAFLMSIEPVLLLANKVRPVGVDTRKSAMTYYIKQSAPLDPLVQFAAKLSSSAVDANVAANIVRGVSPGDDDKMMTIFPDTAKGRVIFLYRSRNHDSSSLMRYQDYSNGILSPVINKITNAGNVSSITEKSSAKGKVITFDILFLSFVLAAKHYIIKRKTDPAVCSVPEEFEDITKGAPFVVPVAPVQAPVVPVQPQLSIQIPPSAPVKKCTDVIFKATNRQSTPATLIRLGENHVNYFKGYPFCFREENSQTLTKGSLYDYKFFQDQINIVVGKVCRGEITDTTIIVQPGFWQDIHITGAMIPDEKYQKDKIYDLTSLGGEGKIPFNCRERTTQEKMGRWAATSVAAQKSVTATPLVLEDYTPSSPKGGIDYAAAAAAAKTQAAAKPTQCSTLVDVQQTDNISGVVLGTSVANALKAFPLCLNVDGYASIKTSIGQKHYNIVDLTSKINSRLPFGFSGRLPGFNIIGGRATMITTGMMAPGSTTFFFLKPQSGGRRRTQKKRVKTSKKFTQSKRWQ